MKIIDTHCHIFKEYYEDIPFLMSSFNDSNIDIVINSAVDINTSKEVIELSKRFDNMYCTVGIHPEDQDNYTEDDLKELEKLIENKKVVAIGEIGLDYHYEGFDKEKQRILFEKQLDFAEKYHLPVVIHHRDAGMDTINILKKHKVTGVIHCFSGSKELAKEYIKLGFFLGVGGVVTFKNAKVINVIKDIGIEHYVLETDSPYLTPEPNRGKTNTPIYLNDVVKFLSNNLNLSEDEVIEITSKNAQKLFKF